MVPLRLFTATRLLSELTRGFSYQCCNACDKVAFLTGGIKQFNVVQRAPFK